MWAEYSDISNTVVNGEPGPSLEVYVLEGDTLSEDGELQFIHRRTLLFPEFITAVDCPFDLWAFAIFSGPSPSVSSTHSPFYVDPSHRIYTINMLFVFADGRETRSFTCFVPMSTIWRSLRDQEVISKTYMAGRRLPLSNQVRRELDDLRLDRICWEMWGVQGSTVLAFPIHQSAHVRLLPCLR